MTVKNLWITEYSNRDIERQAPPCKIRRKNDQHDDFFSWRDGNDSDDDSITDSAGSDEYDDWQCDVNPAADKQVRDPFEYWRQRQMQYPRLSRMAFDVLSIPPASDEIERIFSLAGLMVTPHRNRLEENTVESVQMLRSFLKEGIIRQS